MRDFSFYVMRVVALKAGPEPRPPSMARRLLAGTTGSNYLLRGPWWSRRAQASAARWGMESSPRGRVGLIEAARRKSAIRSSLILGMQSRKRAAGMT